MAERLKYPEFRKEYEALEPERELISSFIEAREKLGLTQNDISKSAGISQSDISKLERGLSNPTFRFLMRIADGFGMRLSVKFVPKNAVV